MSVNHQTATAVIARFAALTATVFMLAACGEDVARSHALKPDDSALLATGAKVYAAHCAACHGAALEGQPDWRRRDANGLLPAPPHDASGHTWHHDDETLFRITKFGVGSVAGDPGYKTAMPVYEGQLSDQEIVAVLSWIKSRWPESVREKHDQFNARTAKTSQ